MEPAKLKLLSPLEKLLPNHDPAPLPVYAAASALRGEETAFQAVCFGDGVYPVRVTAPSGVFAEVFRVGDVPAGLAAYPDRHDADYLSTEPGLFPDILFPVSEGVLSVGRRATLWVSLRVAEDAPAGPKCVLLSVGDAKAQFTLTVIPALLPPQRLRFTQWFHTDCIASLYRLPVYSEPHWAKIGEFMRCAAAHGINVLLTPVLTPPLDTAVGGERPCTQLVEIVRENGAYRFDFAKLRRWVTLAREAGIEQFEVSHLFSQWGARFAPNIYAFENGRYGRIFGWDTPADAPAYAAFLRAFLPALLDAFREMGVQKEDLLFHISDEPGEDDLETYTAAKHLVEPLLAGCAIRDALSSFALYTAGAARQPIVATDHIEPFLKAGVTDLWAYNCCGQNVDVSNRFLAMPAARTRILGVQLWKHRITGFLHWGFNFWYTQHSLSVIDPFTTSDAGGAFPGGDAFSVYPGEDGPLCSTRLKVFWMALEDIRALELLESRIGFAAALDFLGEGRGMTFSSYPRSADYLLRLRERVNAAIASGP